MADPQVSFAIVAKNAAGRVLADVQLDLEKVAARARGVGETFQGTNSVFEHLEKGTEGSTRGLQMLERGLTNLTGRALGIEGPIGKILEGVTVLGAGSTAVLGFTAGFAAMTMAMEMFGEEAKRDREIVDKLRDEADKLRRTPVMDAAALQAGLQRQQRELEGKLARQERGAFTFEERSQLSGPGRLTAGISPQKMIADTRAQLQEITKEAHAATQSVLHQTTQEIADQVAQLEKWRSLTGDATGVFAGLQDQINAALADGNLKLQDRLALMELQEKIAGRSQWLKIWAEMDAASNDFWNKQLEGASKFFTFYNTGVQDMFTRQQAAQDVAAMPLHLHGPNGPVPGINPLEVAGIAKAAVDQLGPTDSIVGETGRALAGPNAVAESWLKANEAGKDAAVELNALASTITLLGAVSGRTGNRLGQLFVGLGGVTEALPIAHAKAIGAGLSVFGSLLNLFGGSKRPTVDVGNWPDSLTRNTRPSETTLIFVDPRTGATETYYAQTLRDQRRGATEILPPGSFPW